MTPLLYYFVLLCKSFIELILSFGSPPLSRKADAKIRTFRYTLQIFPELFSRKIPTPYQSVNRPTLPAHSGVPFVPESGCKSRGFLNNSQTFEAVFLKIFSAKTLTRCITNMLHNIFNGQNAGRTLRQRIVYTLLYYIVSVWMSDWSPIVSRSNPVRPSLLLRFSFDTTPFGIRSGFVREARTNEEGTEEQQPSIYTLDMFGILFLWQQTAGVPVHVEFSVQLTFFYEEKYSEFVFYLTWVRNKQRFICLKIRNIAIKALNL